MKLFVFFIFILYSSIAFSYRLTFDHNKLDFSKDSGGKGNISIQNNLSDAILVQLWSQGVPIKTIKIKSKKEKNLALSEGEKYSIVGIAPPTKKIFLE